jgi:Phospholipid methyltransferase
MHLHYRLSVRKTLTTTGPYTYIRNPIYVGNTIMLLGLTVLSELLWFFPVMFLWCMVVYTFVVRREEAHLAGKYGQPYAEFLKSIPRWIPRARSTRKRGGIWPQGKSFFWPSVAVELHCLLWLVPLAGKEMFASFH